MACLAGEKTAAITGRYVLPALDSAVKRGLHQAQSNGHKLQAAARGFRFSPSQQFSGDFVQQVALGAMKLQAVAVAAAGQAKVILPPI